MSAISSANAQVTIGEIDEPKATLDVRGRANDPTMPDGILAPRLTGNQLAEKEATTYGDAQNGELLYVTEAASLINQVGKTVNVKSSGFYYYDAPNSIWVALAKEKPEWFYMPQSLINVEIGTEKTIDLFAAYNASLTSTVNSAGSSNFSIFRPALTEADYYYYVVGYDTNIFENISISVAGVMTYDIIDEATEDSFINIVFVRK